MPLSWVVFTSINIGKIIPEIENFVMEGNMNGEIDFKQSFYERVLLLKGLPESVLQQIGERLVLTEGAEKLISTLRNIIFVFNFYNIIMTFEKEITQL